MPTNQTELPIHSTQSESGFRMNGEDKQLGVKTQSDRNREVVILNNSKNNSNRSSCMYMLENGEKIVFLLKKLVVFIDLKFLIPALD